MTTTKTAIASTLRAAPATPAGGPKVAASDAGLPGLSQLFDRTWAWETFCDRFGPLDEKPDRLRLEHFSHDPGRRAVVGYVAERRWDDWVAEDRFAIELKTGGRTQLFRFPDDPYLPGLRYVASALEAQRLLPRYVQLRPQRLYTETVRYLPTERAVLRHFAHIRGARKEVVTLYVRVMRPQRLGRLLAAGRLAERSAFVLPRLAGCWEEFAVAWMANTPGETVRTLIREGAPPEPDQVLDGLAPLWSATDAGDLGTPYDLARTFLWTERLLSTALADETGRLALRRVTDQLRPFAEEWRPTAPAHNDFYDDQLISTPSGRLALVDFEEAGPGDPLLDIGNLLAHLRWMSRLSDGGEPFAAYRRAFRSAALDRFGWDGRALALREAYGLFRLSSNPVREAGPDLSKAVQAGLSLAAEVLDGAA